MRFLSRTLIAAGIYLISVMAVMAGGWTAYKNPRFGTSVDVPVGNFAANQPPANGDGQSWTAADGKSHISVYGGFMVSTAETFAGYRDFSRKVEREDGVKITYEAGKGDWFVLSGFRGSDIVYMKAVLSRRCSPFVVNHIYLRYPASKRAEFDPIVTRMAKSLRGGRGFECQ